MKNRRTRFVDSYVAAFLAARAATNYEDWCASDDHNLMTTDQPIEDAVHNAKETWNLYLTSEVAYETGDLETNSASIHTGGPWKTDGKMVVAEEGFVGICRLEPELQSWPDHDGIVPTAEQEANGRLIAAAPDLLKACKAMIASREPAQEPYSKDAEDRFVKERGEAWTLMSAAIAKATP
jgi:hypothetical protein